MRRLTLRDSENSRFLARIVERDGFVFVLDFGESDWISAATDRVHKGVQLDGRHVGPGAPDLLDVLAELYRREGVDARLERPLTTHVEAFVFKDPEDGPASVARVRLEEAVDDEETELVPEEMRRRAIASEDEVTAVHSVGAIAAALLGDD